MKYKTTKKAIREMGYPVFCIGYCDLQNLLRFVEPFAYSTRAEGWACDYYKVGDIILCTGYAPIGRKIDYNLCKEYDKAGQDVFNDRFISWEEKQEKVKTLLDEFIGKLTVKNGGKVK